MPLSEQSESVAQFGVEMVRARSGVEGISWLRGSHVWHAVNPNGGRRKSFNPKKLGGKCAALVCAIIWRSSLVGEHLSVPEARQLADDVLAGELGASQDGAQLLDVSGRAGISTRGDSV